MPDIGSTPLNQVPSQLPTDAVALLLDDVARKAEELLVKQAQQLKLGSLEAFSLTKNCNFKYKFLYILILILVYVSPFSTP